MKKIVGLILSCSLLISLAACSSGSSEGQIENSDSIVAVVNGVNITRGEVGTALRDAEQQVISDYILEKKLDEFFSSITVEDSEIELQVNMAKSQIGEESWPLYLTYYAGGSEDIFRENLRKSLAQEKYIVHKAQGIEISDEEALAEYNKDVDHYNIAVLDCLFLPDEETLEQAIELCENGATLEEISEEVGVEVSEGEHTYYKSETLTWSKSFNECIIGDMVYTDQESGNFVVGRITELHAGIEDKEVYDGLIEDIKYDLAYAATEEDYIQFLKEQKVSIFGEPYVLYEDEETIG